MKTFQQFLNEAARWKQVWEKPPTDVIERLKKWNLPYHYCHFSYVNNKLGVHPGSRDSLPGIYGYKIDHAIEVNMKLEYGGGRPYIWVFKAKNPQRVVTINGDNYKIWKLAKQELARRKTPQWFLSHGVEGIEDDKGVIFPGISRMVVFFGGHAIIPLDVFKNSLAMNF